MLSDLDVRVVVVERFCCSVGGYVLVRFRLGGVGCRSRRVYSVGALVVAAATHYEIGNVDRKEALRKPNR